MKLFFSLGLIAIGVLSCQKEKAITNPTSVLIVQANPDVNPVYPVFGNELPRYFYNAIAVGYGSSWLYNTPGMSETLTLYQSTDTGKAFFGTTLDLEPVGIYSYFLAGNASKLDTVLIKENLSNYADGSVGFRVINLSPGSAPMSVNFEATPARAEFSNLSYKQYGNFKSYPQSPDGYYNLEIHDQATGDLLTTFGWFYTPGKNNTIVISGSTDPSSSTPLTVFQVNHF